MNRVKLPDDIPVKLPIIANSPIDVDKLKEWLTSHENITVYAKKGANPVHGTWRQPKLRQLMFDFMKD